MIMSEHPKECWHCVKYKSPLDRKQVYCCGLMNDSTCDETKRVGLCHFAPSPHPAPAPGGLVCEICHKQMEAEATRKAREDVLDELYNWLDEKVDPDEAMMRVLTIGAKIKSLRSEQEQPR